MIQKLNAFKPSLELIHPRIRRAHKPGSTAAQRDRVTPLDELFKKGALGAQHDAIGSNRMQSVGSGWFWIFLDGSGLEKTFGKMIILNSRYHHWAFLQVPPAMYLLQIQIQQRLRFVFALVALALPLRCSWGCDKHH